MAKSANVTVAEIGDTVTFTLKVYNRSASNSATGVEVTDPVPEGTSFISTTGAYDDQTGVWTVGTVAADDSAEVDISLVIESEGIIFNLAEITASPTDTDSTPGNGVLTEDDIASACVSVAMYLSTCGPEPDTILLNAPSGHTNYVWYDDGVPIPGATDSIFAATEPGIYTYTTDLNPSGCEGGNCCPIIVLEGYCLGNLVWEDLNNDGTFDPADGETGIEGLEVILYSPGPDGDKGTLDDYIVALDTTDANGNYLFSTLPPGDYFVKLNGAPDGYVSSTGDGPYDTDADGYYELAPGLDPDVETADDDDNGLGMPGVKYMAMSGIVTLAESPDPNGDGDNNPFTNLTIDFGLYAPDTFDLALVKTTSATTVFLGDTVEYEIRVYNQGTVPAYDVVVSDYVPADLLFDGTLNLAWSLAGSVYQTTLAGPIAPGSSATVSIFLVVDLGFTGTTIENVAEISQADDDADINTTPPFDIDSDADNTGGDIVGGDNIINNANDDEDDHDPAQISVTAFASLGDYVWYDADGDGQQDGTETGVADVIVILYDGNGNEISRDTTDTNGNYLFENLDPGDYYVVFDTSTIPDGYMVTLQDQGGDASDSDAGMNGQTAVVTLGPGETNLDLDLGINPKLAALGDYVWFDNDGDGQQGGTETGVQGVEVILFDANNNEVGRDTTDAGGLYLFTGLPAGDYHVEFTTSTLPGGYAITTQNQGSDATDSDGDSNGVDAVTTLDPGETDLTHDLGLAPLPASLGDYVWYDADGDGQQDGTETGVADVIVILYDSNGSEISRDTTDTNGNYLFENLDPGDYYVVFDTSTIPDGYMVTLQNQGGDTSDSDAGMNGQTAVVTLGPGETNLDLDLGINPKLAALGDYVWYDNDGDGQQGGTETGVQGVEVILFDANNNEVGRDTTDADGLYLFTGLPAGDYHVEFTTSTLPGGYAITLQNQGADATDSDGDSNGVDAVTTLDPGETDLTHDLGLAPLPASLGDYVWYDADGDGQQDGTETGVADVIVILYDSNGNEISRDTTDTNGNYLFENLDPGDYYVVFDTSTIPDGYMVTLQDQGGDASDSDAGMNGQTAVVTLGPGETNLDLDLGINPKLAALGDYVWYDNDGDGQQGGTETGVQGVEVILFDANNNEVGRDTTDAGGLYLFTGLPAGDYHVEFTTSTLPGGYAITLQNQGSDATDSDGDSNGVDAVTTLDPGETDLTHDLGLTPLPASLGDYVWNDADGDGQQGGTETGVADVIVILYDGNGNEISRDTTDTNGNYLFENLDPGDYYVVFDTSTIPDGYMVTLQDQGDDASDSDAGMNGQTAVVTLGPGETNLDLDLGINPKLAALGDYVWYDNDGDGQQGGTETGVQGVEVILFDANNNEVGRDTTDAGGLYLFTGLPAGDYHVEFTTSTLPGGYAITTQNQGSDATDSDGDSNGVDAVTTLDPGETDLTHDLGLAPLPASLGDYVWYDADGDGQQDGTETGVADVIVILYDGNGNEISRDTTDTNGNYLFENLDPGDYYVVFDTSTIPDGYMVTLQNQGGDASDSDAGMNGQTAVVTLGPGETNLDLDLGINPKLAALGDYVWYDNDGDGQQDGTETGVQGVEVILFDANNNEVSRDTTDAGGLYLFTGLPAGDYHVEFTTSTLPGGYAITTQNQGADATDSDGDAAGVDAVTTLDPGETDLTHDLGLAPLPASLGDYVWYDADGDGQQDGTETGVADVIVILYDGNGNEISRDTTDTNGNYLFENLDPGDYYVVFDTSTIPDGYMATLVNQGDDASDSDAGMHGQTPTITLGPDEDNLTIDFGIAPKAVFDLALVKTTAAGTVNLGDEVLFSISIINQGDVAAYNIEVNDYVPSGFIFNQNLNPNWFLLGGNPWRNIPGPLAAGQSDTIQIRLVVDPNFAGTSLTNVAEINNADNDNDPNNGFPDDPDSDGDNAPNNDVVGGNDVTDNSNGDEDDHDPESVGVNQPNPTFVLGSVVWDDADNDGHRDLGEDGIGNVQVILFEDDGDGIKELGEDTPIDTVYTDANTGEYLFTGLAAGDYWVKLNAGLPTNFVSSTGDGQYDKDEAGFYENTGAPLDPDLDFSDDDDNGVGMGTVNIDYMVMSTMVTLTDVGPDPNGDGDNDIYTELTVDFGLYDPKTFDLALTKVSTTAAASPGDPVTFEIIVHNQGDVDAYNISVTDYVPTGFIFNAGDNLAWTLVSGNPTATIAGPIAPGGMDMVSIVLQIDPNFAGTDLTNDAEISGADDDNDGNTPAPNDEDSTPDTTPGDPFGGDNVTDNSNGDEDDNDPATITVIPVSPMLASIGDYVWLDTDKDGIQEMGEMGVPDVEVILYDDNQNEIARDTTDANGFYLFTSLPPGDYQIYFNINTLPNGYVVTLQNVNTGGGNDSNDSDAGANGWDVLTNLVGGEMDLTHDLGVYPALFDLALIKQLANGQSSSVNPGEFVTFTITVQNQGMLPAYNVQITDYIPSGFIFHQNLNTNWSLVGNEATITIPMTIPIAGSASVNIVLQVDPNLAGGTSLTNEAEISSSDDDNDPNNGTGTDSDSDADSNPGDPFGGNDVTDNSNGDEDDSDREIVSVDRFDLALAKSLAPGQPVFVNPGNVVNFRITVYNQGSVAAANVVVTDYLPAGLTLIDPDWTNNGNGTASITLPGMIPAGGSAFVDITFSVPLVSQVEAFINLAEITSATDQNGNPRTDIDSNEDADKGNDTVGGNDTVQNENGDEDDHDYEVVVDLPRFDPQGYIYCDKTGKVIMGGTISVTGPGDVYFVNGLDGSNGVYQFYTDGTPGTYTVSYSHPNGFPLSPDCLPQGGSFDPTGQDGGPFDQDGDPNNGLVTLGLGFQSGDYMTNWDCVDNPYYMSFTLDTLDPEIHFNNIPVRCSFIGAVACTDANGNDQIDPTDPPLGGITVYLYDCADLTTPLDTQITNALGEYAFDGLTPGNYQLGFLIPPGTRPVATGPIDQNGFSQCITLDWSECDTTQILCLYACPDITATASPDTICVGESTLLDVPGITGFITWTPAASLSNPNIPNPVATPIITTTYRAVYDDAEGCTDTAYVTVVVVPLVDVDDISVTATDSDDCFGGSGSITVLNFSGLQVEYSLDTGSTWTTNGSFVNLDPGVYTLWVRPVGTDNKCVTSFIIGIDGVPPMVITEGESDHFLCEDDFVTVSITTSNPISSWSIIATSGYANVQFPNPNTITFNAYLEGVIDNFSVTLVDSNGCLVTEFFDIYRISDPIADFVLNSPECSNDTVCFKFTGTASPSAILNWNVGDGTIVYSSPSTQTDPAGAEICVLFPSSGVRMIMLMVDDNGCTDTHTESVNIRKAPTAIAPPDLTICYGQCTTLVGNTAGGLLCWWEPNTPLSNDVPDCDTTVCPTVPTNYVFWVCDANNCKDSDTVRVDVIRIVPQITGDTIICLNECTTLTASGGTSYLWSTGETTASINVCPTVNGTVHTVTVTGANACTATTSVSIDVNPLPTPTITTSTGGTAVCYGSSIMLTISPAYSGYLWSTGATTQSITVTPLVPTTYSATVTDANGCTGATSVLTITVNPLPPANAGTDTTICLGSSVTLTATGGVSYAWSTGGNTASITVTPAATTTYTVTVTDSNGCTATDQVTVTVNSTTANAGPDMTICSGNIAMLMASGLPDAVSFLWNTGATTSMIVVSPTSTTTYTVTVTGSNGCTGTDQVTVFVNPIPNATVTGGDTICPGECLYLTASGGVDYLWFPPTGLDQTDTSTVKACPSVTTTYTVFVEDANGCLDTAHVTVVVAQPPTVVITGDISICIGQSTTLTASGGVSYVWSTGATTASITVSPVVTTTYTVTATDANGCTGTASVTVTVTTPPTVQISPNDDISVCPGSAIMLMATGSGGAPGYTFEWGPAAGLSSTTGSPVVATPTVTTTYVVTVTDTNGCTGTDSITITVKTPPQAAITGDLDICAGESTTLTASGGGTYLWNTGATTASITVNPASTTTYSVTVTSGDGCNLTATASATVTVTPVPTAAITGNLILCGSGTTTLTATGGGTYLWNTGATTASITVSPAVTTTYTVTVTNLGGCTATASATVVVAPAPTVQISPNDDISVCPGSAIMLMANASGGTPGYTFEWGPAAGLSSTTGSPVVASPSVTTTYVVTVTDAAGCTGTDQITITVKTPPAAAITGDLDICAGESTTLTASGGGTYLWNTGATTASISVNPASTTTYSVTVTSGDGCNLTATATATVTVTPVPTAAISGNLIICGSGSTTLTATGGGTYLWNTGATTASITVSPVATTTYTVTVTSLAGCTATASATVIVAPAPTVDIQPGDVAVCPGSGIMLMAMASGGTPGYTFAWSPAAGLSSTTGTPVVATPTVTTTYVVTVTDAAGCTGTDQITITVKTPPAAAITGDLDICAGESTTLTASGGGTYLWNTGATTASITVNPASTTTYSVTVTSGDGCNLTATASATVTVTPIPTAAISGNLIICGSGSTTLTATGGGTYLWNTGATTASITVSPIVTTTYTVTVTSLAGCTATASATVIVAPAPTVEIMPGDVALCPGSGVMLMANASGGTPGYTYNWGPASGLSSTTGQAVVASPTVTTTYTVTVTDAAGCTATDQVTVTIKTPPVAAITGDLSICAGESTTLTASGGGTYLWNTGATTASITVNPASTTTYSVTVTGSDGCNLTATATATVTVTPRPTAAISGNLIICGSGSTTLTATGGGTYLWNTGATTASITVSPVVTTTYTVTVTNLAGCTATASATVVVSPAPTVDIMPGDVAICPGSGVMLMANASGGTPGYTYNWGPASGLSSTTGQAVVASPTVTTTYTVTVTDAAGCTATDQVTVTIKPTPVAAITGDLSICAGESTTLTASGGGTYLWSTGATTASISVNPASTTTYSVTVTSSDGCNTTATASATVIVTPAPTPTISGNTSICVGQNTTLTASGGTSYVWNTLQTTASIVVAPVTTTTYTVTVSNAAGCTATTSVTVTVNPPPSASITGDQNICAGESTTLTATGGGTYLWNTGATTASITVNPIVSTSYTVTVTSAAGCSATASVSVTVNPAPTPAITGNLNICLGSSTTLTASGGGTYLWSTGATTSSISVNPASTTTYSVTVTSAAGCTASTSATVTVNPPATPVISGDLTICQGESTTLTASGGVSYVWNTGATTASITVSPASTTTYTVTATNANGCTGTATATVTVNPRPTVTIQPGDVAICEGSGVMLMAVASGGTPGYTFSWGPASGLSSTTDAMTLASPTTTTTYTVTVTDANGCTATASVTVTIKPAPNANAGADQTICAGQTATLTATGGGTYIWNTGATTASITVSPTVSTIYTVTVTGANGCTDSDNVLVNIGGSISVSAGADQTICAGQTATLTASGGTSYVWNTGATTASISVTPATTTVYTVTVTNASGCTGTDDVVVTIAPSVTADAGADQTICAGQGTVLTASGGVSYVWNTGATTATINVSPASTTTYTVTVTSAAGCTGTDAVTITVMPLPTANAGPDQTVCSGGSVTLTATGGTVYMWSNGTFGATNIVSPVSTTTYTVTVSAGFGCTSTDQVTVTVAPALNINATVANGLCGPNDGAISLSVTGGSGNYSYVWNPNVSTGSSATGLATGTYSVTVTDNVSGCTATASRSVNGGNGTSINLSATSATCSGTDGAIIVSNVGGTSPYTIQWSGGASGSVNNDPDGNHTISNLGGGNYRVTVSDANGCTDWEDVVVPSISISLSATATNTVPVTCFGGNNGVANVNISNGTAPFTIRFNSVVKTTTGTLGNNIITGLTAGVYSVEITDANGCSGTTNLTVTQPSTDLQVVAYAFQANCCGVGGSVEVAVNGGTPNYSYSWSPNVSTGSTAPNVPVGTYTITVTDANGCSKIVTATVTPNCDNCTDIIEIDSIPATPDDTIEVCLPGISIPELQVLQVFVDGSLYLGPYHNCDYDTLVIYNYGPLLAAGPAPFRLLNWYVGPDSYSDSTIVNIQELVANMNVWDPGGNWQLDAATNNIVGGLTNSATYGSMEFLNLTNWTPTTLNPNYGGLATGTSVLVPGDPGKHTIVLVDPVTCCRDTVCVFVAPFAGPAPGPMTMNYTILQGENVNDCFDLSELTGSLMHTDAVVNASNGQLDLTNAPCFTYTPDAAFVGVDNMTVVLCDGVVCDTFFIIVTVKAPCGDILAETEINALATACNVPADVCVNLPLDQIPFYNFTLDGQPYTGGFAGCNFDSAFTYLYSTVPNQGAVGPYNVSWTVNGNPNNSTFNNLAELVSWMNSIDPTGNWVVNVATLTIRGGVQANTYGQIAIVQTNTGGTATLDPSLSLSPNGVNLKIPNGTHTIVLTEKASGCSDSLTIKVSCPYVADQSAAVTIQEGFNGTICFNTFVTNGATITGIINTCPNQSGNAGLVFNAATNCMTYTGLQAGVDTACVEVCLSTGQCFTVTVTVTVTAVQPCTGFITRSTFKLPSDDCNGYRQTFCVDIPNASISNYSITLNGNVYTGGLAPCNYEGNGSGTGTEIAITEGGTHTMIFTRISDGCSDTITVEAPCVRMTPTYIVAEIQVGDIDTVCLDIEELPGNVLSVENACPGTGEYVIFDRITGSVCYLCTGVEVGFENVCFVLCDDQGYCDTTYLAVTVREKIDNPQQVPNGFVDLDTTLTNTPIVLAVLNNDSLVGLNAMFVNRQPAHGIAQKMSDNRIEYTPFNEYCNEQTPDNFEYVICNSAGCDTVQVFVWVFCDKLKVYTGFSPNNDQMNDFFVIEGLNNFPNNKLSIFNRWGNLVYSKENYDNSWDGTWRGEPLLDGTYFWLFEDDKGNVFSGYVQIMR